MTAIHPTVVRIVRIIAAPPARVYRAWLDPDLIRRWFAPSDYSVGAVVVEERVGGRHSIEHVVPHADGPISAGGFESRLLELVPDRRIVFAWGFVGPDRRPDPTHESRLTVQLAPLDDEATELTLVHERLEGLRAAMPEVADGVSTGWNQAIAKLAAELAR